MASGSFVQSSFVGGEWSPRAQGQTIDSSYKTALARCSNGYPISERAWMRRPGFRHVAPTRKGLPARLLEYNVTDQAPYNMVLSSGYMRFQSGTELLKEAENFLVLSISADKPALVTVASAHGWATANQVTLEVNDAPSKLNLAALLRRQFEIDVVSPTTFYLLDPVTNAPIDGALITWSGSTASVRRVVELVTPYTGELWKDVRLVETDDLSILLNGSVAPRKLVVNDLDSVQPSSFEIDVADFRDGPYLDPVRGSIATPSAVSGIIDLTLSFTAYSATVAYSVGDYVSIGGTSYKSIADQNVNHTPSSSPLYWEVATPGDAVRPGGFNDNDLGRLVRMHSNNASWTWGKIVGFPSSGVIDLSAATTHTDFATTPSKAFDGNTTQVASACAAAYLPNTDGSPTKTCYIGKHFTPTPQRVSSAVITPSTDLGYSPVNSATATPGVTTRDPVYTNITFYLIGSQDGVAETILGQTAAVSVDSGQQTIISNDVTTAWAYVYVKAVVAFHISYSPNYERILYVAEIRMFSDAGVAGAGVQVQVLGDPLASTSAMTTWRLGLFGAEYGYPTCGCYTEGRLLLAGAVPNRIDASKSNAVLDFEPTAPAGTVADNNGFSYVFNSSEKNTIFWMEPTKEGVICGTPKGEWLVDSTEQSGGLGPTSTKARRITNFGCANVLPVVTGMTTLFAQRHRKQLYEYLTDAYSGKFFGSSLSEKAKHITKENIAELVYQQEQAPTVWARMDDNSLAGMLYRRTSAYSSQPPDFLGWHRHIHGGAKDFTSVCVGPSVSGDIDTLSVVTKDANGIHHIEILTDYPDEGANIRTAWQVDDGVAPVSGSITTNSEGREGVRFFGLWHLERREVAAFIAGLDCGNYTVESGSIFVPFTNANALFTKAKLNALTVNGEDYGQLATPLDGGLLTIPAVVGYNFVSQGQLVRPAEVDDGKWGQTGARNGPAFGKVRRVHEYAAHVEGTQGIYVGTAFDKLRPAQLQTKGGTVYAADELFSGIHGGKTDDPHSTEGMLCWEIRRPYPASVLQLGGFLTTEDK